MRVCYQEVVDEVITEESGVENGLVEQQGSDKDEPSPKKLELKELPSNLKYAFLEDNQAFLVIIAANLDSSEEQRLLVILRKYRKAIGWTLDDIKRISPTLCMHKILLEEDTKPTREAQRRLNPIMQEVVKKEVLKLLDVGIIYPISDSKWVSPIHVVPKKSEIMVVKNEQN